jgi:lysozyme
MEIKTLDTAGINFIAQNEGNVLHPYLDSAGIPTIGIGMTYYPDTGKKITMQDKPITAQQSVDYFKMMVKPRELTVYALTRHDLTQNEFNSLVDFEYNTGHLKGSTLLQMVNSKQDVAAAFLMWDKEHRNGLLVENEGLKERRLKEIALYKS